MGSKITHDHLGVEDDFGPKFKRVGSTFFGGVKTEQTVRWKLMDEDDVVHYSGIMDLSDMDCADDADEYEEKAYALLKWGESDTGATDLVFCADDLPEALVARHREIGAIRKIKGSKHEWVMIYG